MTYLKATREKSDTANSDVKKCDDTNNLFEMIFAIRATDIIGTDRVITFCTAAEHCRLNLGTAIAL